MMAKLNYLSNLRGNYFKRVRVHYVVCISNAVEIKNSNAKINIYNFGKELVPTPGFALPTNRKCFAFQS